MIVLCKNRLWELDMNCRLYQSLKEREPETIVEIEELTASSYKKQLKVPIRETFDWSIYRNQSALGHN